MMGVLTQNRLNKPIGGKSKKFAIMTNKQWEELKEKALSTIQLYLATQVLRKLLDQTNTAVLWL